MQRALSVIDRPNEKGVTMLQGICLVDSQSAVLAKRKVIIFFRTDKLTIMCRNSLIRMLILDATSEGELWPEEP